MTEVSREFHDAAVGVKDAHIATLEVRIRELEEKLRLTEGAFKNTRISELEAENAALRHDLARSMANHVADINTATPDADSPKG